MQHPWAPQGLCRPQRGRAPTHMLRLLPPTLGSAPQDTHLCNFIITLAQPVWGFLTGWAGGGQGSHPPVYTQVCRCLEEGIVFLQSTPGLSLHSRLLCTPIYHITQMALSVEQDSRCTWPRWWWVGQDETLLPAPSHTQRTCCHPTRILGTGAMLGQLRQEGALFCRRKLWGGDPSVTLGQVILGVIDLVSLNPVILACGRGPLSTLPHPLWCLTLQSLPTGVRRMEKQ